MSDEKTTSSTVQAENNNQFCSFCGKAVYEVKKLVSGRNVCICDECINLCNDIMADDVKNEIGRDVAKLPTPRQIYNFLNDYFNTRYDTVLEPATYLSLEQQFDRATVSAYSTFRVNDFYTQLERLPEVRVDFQRQELFGGLYYQGESSLGYYRTKWRDFDRPRIYGNRVEPKDYDSFRRQ